MPNLFTKSTPHEFKGGIIKNPRCQRASASFFSKTLVATAIGLSFIATPSLAQQTEPATAEQDEVQLEVITVNARRRSESMQETPIAVSAFSAKELERRGIENTQDLDRVTPSLQFATSGQLSGNNSAAVVFIRGVGQLDPTSSVDPGVGIYVDDVYMGRSAGGAMDFKDIQSVEVLRGPQGTLFGRNTIGGAVLVKTAEPSDMFGGKARLRIGEDNLREAFVAVDLPITTDLLSRFSAGTRKRDGYVTRVYDGQDLGNDDTYSLNGTIQYTPSDNFKVTLKGDYTKEDENGSPFVFAGINESAPVAAIVSVAAGCPGATIPFAPIAPGDPRFGAPNVPNIDDPRCANDFQSKGDLTNGGTAPVESTLEGWGLSAALEWEYSKNITLKSITAYRSTEWTGIRDADNTPFDMLTTDVTSDSEQFSQEFQLIYDNDKISGITGLYYFDESSDDKLSILLAFPPSPPVIGSLLNGGPGSRDYQVINLETESFAVFSEWAYELNDDWSVSAGLRYTEDDKGFQGTIMNIFPATAPDPATLPTQATSEGGPLFIFNRPFSDTYSATTGSASVRYKLQDNINTYLSYSSSFKSGGFNSRYNAPTADNLPISFGEEEVSSWEIGVKADVTNDFRVNVAAFMSEYSDIQLIFRQGVVPLLFNAGSASIDGVELEFTYIPTRNWLIEGGFSYLDDKIDSITEVSGAEATITPDNSLPLTPEWQGNLGAAYSIEVANNYELTSRVDVSYTASQYFDSSNTEIVAQNDGVTYVTASLKLDNLVNYWDLTFGVNNLTDERYLEQGNASLATLGYAEAIYARPRNWFLSFSTEF
ncbi:MAG: TonB-dependent receptor [Alteromonadaceae bacterium]|nr:TonB-dependent receptor [Alteromonadaceae bacterium]